MFFIRTLRVVITTEGLTITMIVKVVIPVYNPDGKFSALLAAYKQQTIYNDIELLIINSGTAKWFERQLDYSHMQLLNIPSATFDHGGTRQQGVDYFGDADVVVFLTQDAILASNDAIEQLAKAFDNEKVGAAYGRQLPHADASVMAAHSRLYNYTEKGYVYSYEDRYQHGIKTVFLSNSFSAYRVVALRSVGGFPIKTIFGEDMLVAGMLLKNNWSVAYVPEAQVYHSHNYKIQTEFKRAFDTGVFHTKESWLLEDFGKAEGEGRRFVKSEISYVAKRNLGTVVDCIVHDGAKFIGYKLGRSYQRLPKSLITKFSMNKKFWK